MRYKLPVALFLVHHKCGFLCALLFFSFLVFGIIKGVHPVLLRVGDIKLEHNFPCDGSPGVKISLHDLYIEHIPVGWPTRFRLRIFQNNNELEELRIDLPDNKLPQTPAAFSGEVVWFCLAHYLLEEFSDPKLDYTASVELLQADSEEILFSLPVKLRLYEKSSRK